MTIKEIAERADVSIGTVDRVINKRRGVSEETKKKVVSIIQETGFKANTYARNLKLGCKAKIGILIPLSDSEFGYWRLILQGIRKAEEEFAGFGLSTEYAFYDRDEKGSFTSSFHSLETKDCDAFLIAPLPVDEVRADIVDDCTKPLVFIDTKVPFYHPISVVAQNPFKGGYTAGHVMALLSKGGGTYLSIQIHPDAYNSSERSRGFASYMQRDSQNRVVSVSLENGMASIPTVVDQALEKYSDLRGIFTANCIICAVGNHLVQRGRKERIVAVGFDLVEENRRALENGIIDAVISQRPSFQGYTALLQLFRYMILGEKDIKPVDIPIDIYFQENITEGAE